MNIVCVICSDHLEQSNEIVYTRCGHVFHMHCLLQWCERSKTCPQCREKVSRCATQRLYFTFSNNEAPDSSSFSLQERVDSLKFQILLKEKDISYHTAKNLTLAKQNAGLRKEVRSAESEINKQKSAIHALKEQISYFKGQGSECNILKKEITQLKMKLDELKPAQVLLQGPVQDVEDLMELTTDRDTLISYITVMKQEILKILNRCEKLRMTVRTLQEDNTKLLAEKKSFRKEHLKRLQLEEDLMISDSKNMALQQRITELEKVCGIRKNNTVDKPEQESMVSNGNRRKIYVKVEKNESNGASVSGTLKRKSKTDVLKSKIARVKEEHPHGNVESDEEMNPDDNNTSCILTEHSAVDLEQSRSSTAAESSGVNISSESENILRTKVNKKQNIAIVRKEKHKKKKDRHNSSVIDLT